MQNGKTRQKSRNSNTATTTTTTIRSPNSVLLSNNNNNNSLLGMSVHETNGTTTITKNGTTATAFARSESMAYPAAGPGQFYSLLQFHARQNTKAMLVVTAFVLCLLILTSDAIHDMGRDGGNSGGLRLRGSSQSQTTIAHWGGAVRPGYFRVEDSLQPTAATSSSSGNHKQDAVFRFAAVTDLDQLSAVPNTASKPKFRSYLLPGRLQRTGDESYDITFESPRELVTGHNEAGRGAEFSELTIYKDRLLTFDDRTGDVFEILNNADGTESSVVPRFVVTEGQGDTDKGMKWEWATVKDGELYMGSMGKEYTAPDGTVMNTNNLWIGVLNARGELRREDWKERYHIVRQALGATAPGYIIMEAILWSPHLQKWIFLPRRISSTMYDENQDEHKGGTQLVLVDEYFQKKPQVVHIALEVDGLRGFSSFAFVPGTQDRHALAIRSVEENCTGDLDVCKQRSYFSVFDVLTGQVLGSELKYSKDMKFEGVEFVNLFATPDME